MNYKLLAHMNDGTIGYLEKLSFFNDAEKILDAYSGREYLIKQMSDERIPQIGERILIPINEEDLKIKEVKRNNEDGFIRFHVNEVEHKLPKSHENTLEYRIFADTLSHY